MNKEDSLHFVHERLLDQEPVPAAAFDSDPSSHITRRFSIELERGERHVFKHAEANFAIWCSKGSVWITHEGDTRDAIVVAEETYRTSHADVMHVYAIDAATLEIEFDDKVTQH